MTRWTVVRWIPGVRRASRALAAVVAAAALATILVLAPVVVATRGLARDGAAADGDVPLPLTGRLSVKSNGKRYVIDGKQVIPAGSLIKLEEGVRVAGIHGASLEVRGGLRALGGDDGRVQLDGIDFSPTVAPENGVHLNGVELSGCTFAHPEGVAFEGELTVENATWNGAFDLRIRRGFARIMSVVLNPPSTITCVAEKGRAPEVAIRGCTVSSLVLRGASSATVRSTKVSGSFTATDFTDLLVDGCDVSGGLTFTQAEAGSFSKLVLTKCNLLDGATVTLQRPTGPKTTMEKVRIDKFYFGRVDGKADLADKEISGRIVDGVDDPAVSVRAFWQSPQDRKR